MTEPTDQQGRSFPINEANPVKKLFAMMLAMILLLSVAALAEAADYAGRWSLNAIEAEG